MIQDIFPQKLFNEYTPQPIDDNCYVLAFHDGKILCHADGNVSYPKYNEIVHTDSKYIYLFHIDGTRFYLNMPQSIDFNGDYEYQHINTLRGAQPKELAFAGLTAYHLYVWYRDNKVCGRCGKMLMHSQTERMLQCDVCGNQVYPKISPVVIVAVTDGDKLLMTKYANREYTRYSLVAGFVEIGETAEEAVKREVMEEVSLNLKNIRYYKSQPWGLSQSLLMGFMAELDGSSEIKLDENELSEGVWVKFSDIETEPDDFSLTNEMICYFK